MLSEAAETPLLDPAAIDRIRDTAGENGSAFVVEIVQLFIDEAARSLDRLREAGLRSDWATVARVSHSLKSSAATLGLIRLANTCKSLEIETISGTPGPEAPALIHAALEHFAAAIPVLKRLN